jgi:predicted phosphodiesterase
MPNRRLTQVFDEAPVIAFDDEDKFILIGDCHRGDNSWADDFTHNQSLTFHALQHYLKHDFAYVEVGDGDELWENPDFEAVKRAHSHIYWLMSCFHERGRLHIIFGNHNADWKDPQCVEEQFCVHHNEVTQKDETLFPGLKIHEGLVLHHEPTGKRLFVTHGHQGSLATDYLWPVSRFLVRFLWKPLQLVGLHDPTSPAQNNTTRHKVENSLIRWIVEQDDQPLICGHTHRPVFPDAGERPYYNVGSAVHPRCITGLEIEGGALCLVKWWVTANDEGLLQVTRKVLEGPRPIAEV